MSDEELEAAFPSPPPPSPVNRKKLPFVDTVHFIIPKQSDIKDNKYKRCLKHHSVLCKICPIITKARKLYYKSKSSTQKGYTPLESDPSNHGTDPINSGTDPDIHVADPELATDSSILPQLSKERPPKSLTPAKSVETTPNSVPSLLNLKIPSCPMCGCCVCPRGSISKNQTRKIPKLLSLPIIVPPKYRK